MKVNYEVVVLGGGLTGVAAAIAAARENTNVLLVEQYGFLGGAATNAQVNPFMPYVRTVNGKIENINAGIFETIIERLEAFDALHVNKRTFNDEILKLILDRLAKQNNIDVLFHSYLIDATREGNRIKSVTIANKSGKQIISGKYFVDCTGDADLAALSGCSYQLGREEDNLCQPMTLCFRLGNVDMNRYSEDMRMSITAKYKQFQESGKIKNPRENVLMFKNLTNGVVHFNSTRIVKRNPIDAEDISAAEMEAREQTYELYQFMKNNIEGFENSTLLMSAPQIGIRESRMIEGVYKITEEDIMSCKKFDDSIARGNYGIDIHSPDGSGTILKRIPENDYYTIPYRALVPKNVENLLVAGRCISATHVAQSAYRIMPICCSIGEAAGTAVAVALKDNVTTSNVKVKRIQSVLKNHGAIY